MVVDDFLPVDRDGQPVCCGFGNECGRVRSWRKLWRKLRSYESLKHLSTVLFEHVSWWSLSCPFKLPKGDERLWRFLNNALEVRSFGYVRFVIFIRMFLYKSLLTHQQQTQVPTSFQNYARRLRHISSVSPLIKSESRF